MSQYLSKPLALGLAALILLLGLTPLLLLRPPFDGAPIAACHHESAPSPSSSHPSDHFCCLVGHNRAVPSSAVQIAPLQFANLLERSGVSDVLTSPDSINLAPAETSPPLDRNLPIRI